MLKKSVMNAIVRDKHAIIPLLVKYKMIKLSPEFVNVAIKHGKVSVVKMLRQLKCPWPNTT